MVNIVKEAFDINGEERAGVSPIEGVFDIIGEGKTGVHA